MQPETTINLLDGEDDLLVWRTAGERLAEYVRAVEQYNPVEPACTGPHWRVLRDGKLQVSAVEQTGGDQFGGDFLPADAAYRLDGVIPQPPLATAERVLWVWGTGRWIDASAGV